MSARTLSTPRRNRAQRRAVAAGALAMPPFGPAEREAFLERLWAMDVALVAAGFHPLSPWWREQITRFVRSGCRRWVIRAGRRAGKSSALARLAVAVWWFGSWAVPRGDIAVVTFISVSKDEAAARLRTVGEILSALGIGHEPRGEEIEVSTPRAVIFKAIACTAKASVGFTSIFILGDEQALWESRESMANPAPEVMGHLAPTAATQPHAWIVEPSAPHGTDDYHATNFDKGDNASQCVSFAATWTANPTITEADTHVLEPDERLRNMRYGAIPGATVTAALPADDVVACFGRDTSVHINRPFIPSDASSLRGDDFAWLEGGIAEGEVVVIRDVHAFGDAELRAASMQQVVDRIASDAHRIGASTVYGDQREEASLRALFAQHGVRFKSYAWTEQSKDDAVQLLRRLMRERRVILPDHAKLRAELIGMKARLVPSGRIRYETNGLDYASCLITLCHAIGEHDVRLGRRPSDLSMPSASGGRGWGSQGGRVDSADAHRNRNLLRKNY